MKALKISLLLVAVVVLTVSVISKDSVDKNERITNQPIKIDLLAHGKKGVKLPTNA